MEDFVQSSGENGVVVFSLGSMVKNLTEEKANLIASALAQIPQKVSKPLIPDSRAALYYWRDSVANSGLYRWKLRVIIY